MTIHRLIDRLTHLTRLIKIEKILHFDIFICLIELIGTLLKIT